MSEKTVRVPTARLGLLIRAWGDWDRVHNVLSKQIADGNQPDPLYLTMEMLSLSMLLKHLHKLREEMDKEELNIATNAANEVLAKAIRNPSIIEHPDKEDQ